MTNETVNAKDRLSQHKKNQKQSLEHKRQLILKKQKQKQKNQLSSASSSLSTATTTDTTAVSLTTLTPTPAPITLNSDKSIRPRKSRWQDSTITLEPPQRQMALTFLNTIQSSVS